MLPGTFCPTVSLSNIGCSLLRQGLVIHMSLPLLLIHTRLGPTHSEIELTEPIYVTNCDFVWFIIYVITCSSSNLCKLLLSCWMFSFFSYTYLNACFCTLNQQDKKLWFPPLLTSTDIVKYCNYHVCHDYTVVIERSYKKDYGKATMIMCSQGRLAKKSTSTKKLATSSKPTDNDMIYVLSVWPYTSCLNLIAISFEGTVGAVGVTKIILRVLVNSKNAISMKSQIKRRMSWWHYLRNIALSVWLKNTLISWLVWRYLRTSWSTSEWNPSRLILVPQKVVLHWT